MMFKNVNGKLGSMMLGALALISPSSVSADEIALTFAAHDFTLVGEFLGYAADNYVVMTENGAVYVPAAMVTCKGADCIAVYASAAS